MMRVSQSRRRIRRQRLGFTLIELLVSLMLLAVLVGVVFPVALQQYEKWEALKVARDLSHLRVAIETFNGNVRNHPRLLTQTAYPITTSDIPLWDRAGKTTSYTSAEVRRWRGPYIDNAIAATLGDEDAFESGLGIFIGNDIYCVTAEGQPDVGSCERGDWVGILMYNVRLSLFERVNDFLDPDEVGLTATEKASRGKLRIDVGTSISGATEFGEVIYLATPYLFE